MSLKGIAGNDDDDDDDDEILMWILFLDTGTLQT
jgi:hypothetical protein